MSTRPIFITGIGTGVGKTIVSAILVQKLQADYWKPIQSGDLDNSDTAHVRSLVSNKTTTLHPETYRLTQPFSPHKSAALDGIYIDPEKIVLPETSNQLIIEGAGGLMVPLNQNFLMIDLIKKLDAEVILVSKNYLGSINHTLMSAGILKSNGIKLSRLIFSGAKDRDSETIISKHLQIETLHIPYFDELNSEIVSSFAEKMAW
ncbi:dethiobiotin synthase [Daejeonella sp.]|uniref:dethiobiotin synthase n=1 Tax=Daejeonella sp. TaxID=2805397 RepID=UPI00272797FC|nr:dethiobiotin synthase [Daejeonella sp.]MDO8993432.1 dethiobiotin synthase [Daejeonella sp.]MDP2414506.1 dethiobiotin synthase [Daejeonella sp.]